MKSTSSGGPIHAVSPAALFVALFVALLASGSARDAAAQAYVPRIPEPDSALYPKHRKDPRIAPRDAWNVWSTDPHVPKNEWNGWVNRDFFGAEGDPESRRLLPIVENGHLGSKKNPRGFWPYFSKGRLRDSVGELKYVLWVFPNHPRALHLLCMVAKAMHEPGIPIAFFEKALKLFPDRVETRVQFANYLLDIGQTVQASIQIQKALELAPERLPVIAARNRLRRDLGFAETVPDSLLFPAGAGVVR